MNQYEVAVLYDPDLEIDLTKVEDRIKKIFTDNGGEVKSIDNWGKRKLAYKIKGNEYAIYVFYGVELPPSAIKRVDATLNITDEVIRFLITKPDLKAIAKAEAEKTKKAEQASKREEQLDNKAEKKEDKDEE